MTQSFLILTESNVPVMRYLFLNEGMNRRMWIINAAYSKRRVNNWFQQCLFGSKTKIEANWWKQQQYLISNTWCSAYLKKGCPWEQFESQWRGLRKPFSIEFSPSLAWSPWEKQWSGEDAPSFKPEPSPASVKLSFFLPSNTPAHRYIKTHRTVQNNYQKMNEE